MTARDFVTQNIKTRRIFSNSVFVVTPEYYFVPYGLVFEIIAKDQLPTVTETADTNTAIWNTLHDPTKGILGRYNHLMLSEIRDVYAQGRIEAGKVYMKANKLNLAREQFKDAVRYEGDTVSPKAYTFLGLTELFDNHCQEAIAAFEKAKSTAIVPDVELLLYEGITYRDCLHDGKKAKELMDQYAAKKQTMETPLKSQ